MPVQAGFYTCGARLSPAKFTAVDVVRPSGSCVAPRTRCPSHQQHSSQDQQSAHPMDVK
jgi:hypothetical protein